MKNLLFLAVLIALLNSCGSTNNIAYEAVQDAIIGENEMTILKRLGMPTKVEHLRDGGKVMTYETINKGMYLTPNKSPVTINADRNFQTITYTSNVNTVTNDPEYTIYPTSVSYFKVYINKEGNAVRIEQNMTQEQLEIYHERFKHFSSKD